MKANEANSAKGISFLTELALIIIGEASALAPTITKVLKQVAANNIADRNTGITF